MNIAEQEFPFPAEHASNVFGQFDANMKKIEKTLHVTIIFRDDKLKLIGGEKDCDRAKHVIEQLLLLSQRGNDITEQNINYTLSLSMTNEESAVTRSFILIIPFAVHSFLSLSILTLFFRITTPFLSYSFKKRKRRFLASFFAWDTL